MSRTARAVSERCAGLVWHSGPFASAEPGDPDRSSEPDKSCEPDESYQPDESDKSWELDESYQPDEPDELLPSPTSPGSRS